MKKRAGDVCDLPGQVKPHEDGLRLGLSGRAGHCLHLFPEAREALRKLDWTDGAAVYADRSEARIVCRRLCRQIASEAVSPDTDLAVEARIRPQMVGDGGEGRAEVG